MKNKLLVLLCLLIPIALVFPACSESGEAAQETVSIGARLTALESGEATVFKLYEKRMTAVEAKPSGTTVDLGPLNSTDAALQSAIDTLKSEVATLKTEVAALKPSPSTPGIINPGDNVVVTDGDLILSLDKPVEDELYLASGDHQTFRLTIQNNGTSSHTFRFKADFDCETAVSLAAGTELDTDYSYSDSAAVKCNITIPATGVTNVGWTSIRGAGSTDTTWYIGKSRSESIYITFTPVYAAGTGAQRWSWDFGLTEKD